jgi:Fur family zinc uptake transcriptional regulator
MAPVTEKTRQANVVEDEVLRLLRRGTVSLTAHEIQNTLRIRHAMTVYRALDRLMQRGSVHRVESRNSFKACGRPGEPHDAGLFVCSTCGCVDEFSLDAVLPRLQSDAEKRKFTIERTTVELLGQCFECAEGSASKDDLTAGTRGWRRRES